MKTIQSSILFPLLLLLLVLAPSCKKKQEKISFRHTNNTVYVRLQAEPDRLNPLVSTSVYARVVSEQFFHAPLTFDPKTLEAIPWLAVSRPLIKPIVEGPYKGGLSYTFELIKEAKWDDGSPVTAADVVFTFKAIFNPKVNAEAYRSYFSSIRDIVIDPANNRKYTVYTNEQYFLGEYALGTMHIMPAYKYDPDNLLRDIPIAQLADPAAAARLADSDPRLQQFADNFNGERYARDKAYIGGSGPYKLDSWETGQRVRLIKKQNWWGDALAARNKLFEALPDTLDYLVIGDPVATKNAILNQDIDVATQLDSRDFKEFTTNELVTKRYAMHTPSVFQVFIISLNTKDPMLSDKRVRRALAHLLDVDALITNLYEGYASRVNGPFHPSKAYYNKDLPLIPFDTEKARQLLKEAGWEDSNGNGTVDKMIDGERKELELELLVTATSKFAGDMGLMFQASAQKAGVRINLNAKAFPAIMGEHVATRKYQLYAGGFAAEHLPDDPKQLWHTSSDTPSGSNRTGFGNAQTDALIDQIRRTLDETERNRLYRQLQEIIYDEQPMIFMFAPQDRVVISKRFDTSPTLLKPGFILPSFKLNRDIIAN